MFFSYVVLFVGVLPVLEVLLNQLLVNRTVVVYNPGIVFEGNLGRQVPESFRHPCRLCSIL